MRRIVDRWPTGLGLLANAGVVALILLSNREAELFGPSVAVMAGIYLMAYAIGRPWTAWLAFAVLSAVMAGLQARVLDVDPSVGITVVVVALWLWTVAQHRYADGGLFWLQTAGMLAFGAITLWAALVQPRWGILLAGIGFLAHGGWDAYHFKVNRVVNRPWSEFCAVVDLATGPMLIAVAIG
jgi:hypothetical protein